MASRYKYLKVAVTPEIHSQIVSWAEKVGMAQGQFAGLCVQLGLQTWVRTYSPESLLSPSDWANIMKAVGQQTDNQGDVKATE